MKMMTKILTRTSLGEINWIRTINVLLAMPLIRLCNSMNLQNGRKSLSMIFLNKQEEERYELLKRPSPEEILYMPISEKELFDNIKSLPPVSKPFMPSGIYNVRGHNQFDDFNQFNDPKDKPNIDFGHSRNNDVIEKIVPKQQTPQPPPQQPPVAKQVAKDNIFQRVIKNHKTDLLKLKQNDAQERSNQQNERLKQDLANEYQFFDANMGKGKDLMSLFNKVEKSEPKFNKFKSNI